MPHASAIGQIFTLWPVRVATVLYFVATFAWLAGEERLSRIAWTIGCAFFLAHVAAAFQFYHGWSHASAYRETARRTAEVFGINWGGGVYFNYVFTGIWIADVAWWWKDYRRRPGWIPIAVQAFMAFMLFNATVIFATGWTRLMGAAAAVLLLAAWMRTRLTLRYSQPVRRF